jgi:hypothetical protein
MTCMLITLAMQLTCTFENKLACTDNESLAQLLYSRHKNSARLRVPPYTPLYPDGSYWQDVKGWPGIITENQMEPGEDEVNIMAS